jgi:SAM-dependent methyltransferase
MPKSDSKNQLIRFIEQVISSALGDIKFENFVFDCVNDEIPEMFSSIRLTQEFLICVKFEYSEYTKLKLEGFLRKEIIEIQTADNPFFCWFEGDNLLKEYTQPIEDLRVLKEEKFIIDELKNYTHLPSWLDSYLINSLDAKYAPDYERYDFNLDLNTNEIKIYLGTYFPRSYAESFCIFDNIFKNNKYQQHAKKEEINILDIGCGTGGNLIGLLVAINKFGLATELVNVYVIDGNTEALSVLKSILNEFSFRCSFKLNLKILPQTIGCVNDIDFSNVDKKIDFILSFKMICEIIARGSGKNDRSYYEITKKSLPLLSETGLFIILDVTTKQEHINTFNPILMNTQIRDALQESNDYKTLLPLSCNRFEQNCEDECFTQRIFKVTHKQRSDNSSKVAYRVIGRTFFIDSITTTSDNLNYLLIPERLATSTFNTFCSKSKLGRIIDAYKL